MTELQAVETAEIGINEAILRVLGVIDRIIAIAEEENRLFAAGLAVPPAGVVAEKTACAEELAWWSETGRMEERVLADAEPRLRERLIDGLRRMRSVMQENAERLDIARAASRRRVDAIMHVIREINQSRNMQYGASGALAPVARATAPLQMSMKV